MLELERIPDEVFAFDELREDPVYGAIPRAQRAGYIRLGLEAGRTAAAEYAGRDLAALLQKDGVEIRRVDTPSPSCLHAQICYDTGCRQVDLFTDTARRLSRAAEAAGCTASPEQIERLFLAHEFYHWLEYAGRIRPVEESLPLQTRLLGLIPHVRLVRRTGEIAAFAFAKEFCGLPVHPKGLDYLLLGEIQGEDPALRLAQLQQEYQEACL